MDSTGAFARWAKSSRSAPTSTGATAHSNKGPSLRLRFGQVFSSTQSAPGLPLRHLDEDF